MRKQLFVLSFLGMLAFSASSCKKCQYCECSQCVQGRACLEGYSKSELEAAKITYESRGDIWHGE